jgi:CelD/BcsL family acetyltransferase involved in cellulose biosynthesis
MSNSTLAPAPGATGELIRLERVSLATAPESVLSEWKAFEANSRPDAPTQDPDWLRGYFLEDLDHLSSYILYDTSGSFSGSASFLLKDWPLKLHLGEISVAELPLRRLRLLGGSPALPEDEALYDRLFRELVVTPGYDTLYFAQVPTDSFLWKYVTTSGLVRESFYRYKPQDPTPHLKLRFGASFDEYMKVKFSATHRYTLRRKVTRFQEAAQGQVKLVRYTRPEEVGPFLDAAVQISRKTYQWNLHQRGLKATERFERRYRFAANHGWFRSYTLFSGETPCAFLAGYQWNGRYDIDELGFDPAFTRQSPGTVLHLLAIQDMFNHNKPAIIDFGSYDKYKEEFATESYPQCDVMLLRRRPYCRLLQGAHYACRLTSKTAACLLRGLNLKSRIKKTVRNRSVRADKASSAGGEPRR